MADMSDDGGDGGDASTTIVGGGEEEGEEEGAAAMDSFEGGGGGGDDDEDDEDEDEDEEYSESELEMDPDSSLMARPQRALKAQLEAQRDRVLESLRERLENLRVTVSQRERLGQELYATQQQLAKMQLSMEKCHDNFNGVNKSRIEAEEELKVVKVQD